jgi:dolichyl-phosphate beta-glucosyltransferase
VTSLILPAYNPGPLAERTWDSIRQFLAHRPDPWEVLFICDGCTDGTPETLNRLAAEANDPRLRVLSYSPNRGKGFAVRTGLLAARGEHRLFTDVDLAYGFDDVVRVADALRAGAAVAIASREHPESLIQLPPHHIGYAYRRRLQSKVFGTIARTLLPIRHRDTQAGLKGMTAEVAELIMPRLSCNGFGFDCEFLTACARLNVDVTEAPVLVRYEDASSTTKAGTTIKMLKELWRIRKLWPRKGPNPEPRPEAAAFEWQESGHVTNRPERVSVRAA